MADTVLNVAGKLRKDGLLQCHAEFQGLVRPHASHMYCFALEDCALAALEMHLLLPRLSASGSTNSQALMPWSMRNYAMHTPYRKAQTLGSTQFKQKSPDGGTQWAPQDSNILLVSAAAGTVACMVSMAEHTDSHTYSWPCLAS